MVKKLDAQNLSLEKCKENLENVRKKGNQKAITILESQLQKLMADLIKLKQIVVEAKSKYDLMQKDYNDNSTFFKNEAIINGVRNAIAHGNYMVVGTPTPIILFKDIYEGKVSFQASITLSDFYTFIDANSKVALDFIKEKKNEKR